MIRSGNKLQKVRLEGKGNKMANKNVGKLQLRMNSFPYIFPFFPSFPPFLYSLFYTPSHTIPSSFLCAVEHTLALPTSLVMRIDFKD